MRDPYMRQREGKPLQFTTIFGMDRLIQIRCLPFLGLTKCSDDVL